MSLNRHQSMVIQLIIMTLIISSCFAFLQAGLNHASPFLFGALRALSAGCFILFCLLITKRNILLPFHLMKWLLLLGFFSTTLTFGAMFESALYSSTGIGTVLANAQPLILGVLGILLFHEPLTQRRGATLLLGFVGVVLISLSQINAVEGSFLGILFALATSLSSTLGSLLVKKANPDLVYVLPLTAWQLIIGSLPLFVFAWYFEPIFDIHWSPEFIGILLYLALIGTAFSVSIWFRLLQLHDASQLAPYLLLTPIFGLVIAFVFLGETLSGLEIMGILFILGGLYLDFSSEK